jgi:hypothetical protein
LVGGSIPSAGTSLSAPYGALEEVEKQKKSGRGISGKSVQKDFELGAKQVEIVDVKSSADSARWMSPFPEGYAPLPKYGI